MAPLTARLLAVLWFALAGLSAARAQKETLPVLAWFGPPAGEATVERYRELAAAGFTQSFSSFPNADAMQRALDAAQEAGVHLWLSVPELQSDPEKTVQRFRAHPALAGYYLRDEPGAADFAALGTWVKRIQAVDAAHPCYINLFPNYANAGQLGAPNYEEHVRRFVAEVPVPFLSFDHYPVVGKSLRSEWYGNLEIISRAATAAKKPFWAFVLAVAHGPYPVPTIEHLRLQAYSDLLYGAQGIEYFTYWTPKDSTWNFHQAPIETDGKKTAVYDLVKQLNGEIRGLSPVFLGAHVLRVGHLGPVPPGAAVFEPAAPVREVRADGPALVSRLENRDGQYLAIMNRALEGPARHVTIRFDLPQFERIGKDGSSTPMNTSVVDVEIPPGDVIVYRWKSETPPANPKN